MGCNTCKIRKAYDQNPTSMIGRFWRWHIGFCLGWKMYLKGRSEEELQELTERYRLK